MNNYYVTVAPGESHRNNAIVKTGTIGMKVDDDFISKELPSTYFPQIEEMQQWAKEKNTILVFCNEGGFFFRIQEKNLCPNLLSI